MCTSLAMHSLLSPGGRRQVLSTQLQSICCNLKGSNPSLSHAYRQSLRPSPPKPTLPSFAVPTFSPSLPVTMVLLEPISGRRHPLQLHTQSLDHPIVITLHMYYMCSRTHRPPSAVQASTGRAVFSI
ncbi:hypothetical protein BC937DRAFT_92790 [Endogone sp. FLAS-F59071]|nr:hypothetical protein BC937DRAFT_92790 [Endogone sp. FLAS-F59071]|eukprot:RUS15179.1 hypothetical protein BC937DRAFT_92790 [Endogone sp. FLAS-F59071]